MLYCADTWFILKLFEQDAKALELLQNTKYGKDRIIIPLVVFTEGTKKLLQWGISQERINTFFDYIEASPHIILVFPNKDLATRTAHISLTFSLSIMDAFVATTAIMNNCEILLTKDSDYDLLKKKKYVKVQSW